MGLLAEEALITINSVPLSPIQSMVIRVAVEMMDLSLASPDNELVDDGIAIGYRERIAEIQKLLYIWRARR